MLLPKDIKQKFDDLRTALEFNNRNRIKLKANGGNSILFIYPPEEEDMYIKRLYEEFPDAFVISLSELLIEYINSIGWKDFEELYKEYGLSAHQLFKSENSTTDYFSKILGEIKKAESLNKIPFLIRTGVLLGTGIENHIIIDSKIVRELNLPLVVFYPAMFDGDNLKYLNFKLASHYRSFVIY